MSCNCQQIKPVAQPKAQSIQSNRPAAIGALAQSRPALASIRYTGPTSATAKGAVSGRRYTFAHTGAIIQVDPRDKAGLAKVPHLRQI
jgi:hypothetical protein